MSKRKACGRPAFITRDKYKQIKQADRQEMDEILRGFYDQGYEKGKSELTAFLEKLQCAPGIGAATYKKITAVYESIEKA